MNARRILLVDDDPALLAGLQRVLRSADPAWECQLVSDVPAALAALWRGDSDLVLTDLRMPGQSGLDLLAQVRAAPATCELPVIILTGADGPGLRRRALELGVTDFLTKPANPDELVARVRSALRLKAHQDELKNQNAVLARTVGERTAALESARLDLLWRLGKAAEYRDEEPGNHVVRVACYSRVLAEALGLPRDDVEMLFLASPLHDIGKIGVPDHVLLKQDELTPQEVAIVRRHCEIGARILRQQSKNISALLAWRAGEALPSTSSSNPVLEAAATIALTHHERWDGLGYPGGLRGNEVPLYGRIVALADCYDALLSDRPHRAAFPEETVVRTILAGRATHFDTDVCAAFSDSLEELRAIRTQFSDAQLVELAEGVCP